MEARSLPEALRMILDQRGWTKTQLARELGMSWAWVHYGLSGQRSTTVANASRLLDRVGWEIRIAPKTDTGDDVKRRNFMTAAASVAFVPSATTTPYHDPEYVRMLAERAMHINEETGGASAAGWVLRQARGVEAAAVKANRELSSAASWFMRRAAYVLRNADRNDTAERLASSALAYAEKAGNLPQQAAARAALSGIYSSMGRDDLAVVSARRGLKIPELTGENRAWLNARLGAALSGIHGRERDARAAIDTALAIDDMPVIDVGDVAGCLVLPLHRVGADENALAAADRAVGLCADRAPQLQARFLADKTKIALDLQDLSQTAALMRKLSYVAPLTDSRRVDAGVTAILRSSAKWDTVSEIRQARHQLASTLR